MLAPVYASALVLLLVPPFEIDTSIVVATCSRLALLRGALDSLLHQTWARDHTVELVVVDDASTDNTAAYLAWLAKTAGLPVLPVAGPAQGIAAARNAGFAAARGRWIASFDDDQLASPDWLASLRERAERSGAACVGGALTLQLPAGARPGPRTRALLGEHLPYRDARPYAPPRHPATNNVLIHRELLANAGGFDPEFTEGGEDKDLFERLRAAGHPLWFEPAARAAHLIGAPRLSEHNLRWTARRIGASDARCALRTGAHARLRQCAQRLLAAAVRDLPRAVLSRARTRQDARCGLWYTEGLLKSSWALHRPQSRTGAGFLRSLNFRHRNGERSLP